MASSYFTSGWTFHPKLDKPLHDHHTHYIDQNSKNTHLSRPPVGTTNAIMPTGNTVQCLLMTRHSHMRSSCHRDAIVMRVHAQCPSIVLSTFRRLRAVDTPVKQKSSYSDRWETPCCVTCYYLWSSRTPQLYHQQRQSIDNKNHIVDHYKRLSIHL